MALHARHDKGDLGLPNGPARAIKDLERGYRSAKSGIVAHAGGGQGSATPLTESINRVATVGTAGDSVLLPAALVGATLIVKNAAAVNSMNVFPATGDQINALGANAAYAVAVTKTVMFTCALKGTWDTLLTA